MGSATPVQLEPADHLVHFYESDADLAAVVGAHLAEGLLAGDVAVVIATAGHLASFERAMAAAGVDVAAARDASTLVEAEASETLERLMVGGALDPAAFDAVVGAIVRDAGSGEGCVRVYGELVALLWESGQVGTAIELEELWNGLAETDPFSLFCAYPAMAVAGDDHAGALAEVCALHTAVVGGTPAPETQARRGFEGTPQDPRAARHFVAGTLEAWGRQDLIDDAMLVSAELASNAVLHAQSSFEVVVTLGRDGVVRIAVRDGSRAHPTPRAPAVDSPSGRGLGLVGLLASRWGHELVDGGKQVWAELAPAATTVL